MNTRYLFLASLAALAMPAGAQETYEGANIATEDLNGTARYVGMGGAMEALGADISAVQSNPAGLGLFRKSQVTGSMGLMIQSGQEDRGKGSKANVSFDQMGLVWTTRTSGQNFWNFSFNYHKSRNFDQLLNAANKLDNSSANITSYYKGLPLNGNSPVYVLSRSNDVNGNPIYGSNDLTFSQTDDLYQNYLLLGNSNGPFPASAFDFYKATEGYIGEYDLSTAGNFNNRFFLGMTVGIHDVHYKGWSTYHEVMPGAAANGAEGHLYMDDYRKITGTGVDFKLGAIWFPIPESAFRIGLSIATPTYYSLTSSNSSSIVTGSEGVSDGYVDLHNSYDYHLYTPWKFNLSVGHTVGGILALGAGYELTDYTGIDPRVDDGTRIDYYGDAYTSTRRDEGMKSHIEETLRTVHTLKLGMEARVAKGFSLRAGYNFVSPVFEKDGSKAVDIQSLGVSYNSEDSYVNWQSTNRFTLGAGYNYKNFSVDLAYQYSVTNGEYWAFTDCLIDRANNIYNWSPMTKVDNKRDQVLLTVGYKF